MKSVAATLAVISMFFPAVARGQRTATTDQMTVLGLRLGAKFSLPMCDRDKPFTPPQAPCFSGAAAWPANKVILDDQDVIVKFPGSPSEMTHYVEAQVIDGNLEGIVISTFGLRTQDSILAMLKEKYGEPSVFQEENLQNAYGAVYQSHLVSWIFAPLSAPFSVIFKGAVDKIDEGFIYIETNKEFEFQKALIKKSESGPKL